MDTFLKAVAGVLIAVILCLTVSKSNKDISLLLVVATCCIVVAAAASYLSPVFSFFEQLQTLGDLDPNMIGILMKAVGVGMLSEIAGLVCEDAGNAAMGKSLKYLSAAVILYISLPLFTSLLSLLEEILVAV